MNPRTTIWLSGIAAGLFLYILLVERHAGPSVHGPSAPAKLLATLDPSKVTTVEVVRSNQTIRVERANDQWELRNPAYPAQATAIEGFLNLLGLLQRYTEIPAQEIIAESGGLSPFGLDPPAATFKVTEGTNVVQLRVGSKTLLGDRVYVQPVGASGIYTTEIALLEQLPATANQWRNPLLMSAGPMAFDRIAIASGSRSVKLERDSSNQLWRIVEPAPPTRADFAQVEYLLRQLRDARVSQFVTDNPKADLEPYGLQTPETELTLAWGSNVVFQLQFGMSPTNDPGQVYVRSSRHTNVVLLSRELTQLVQRPSTDFRDRVLLSFRPNAVDRIEGQVTELGRTNGPFALQRKSEHEW
jgi:hypothetical protein